MEFDLQGKIIVPKTKEEIIAEAEDELQGIWEGLRFNCGDFFTQMEFVGGTVGRRNRYYLYKKDNFVLLSTGFSEEKLTRANLFLLEEIEFMDKFIKELYQKQKIIGAPIECITDFLQEEYERLPPTLRRLGIIIKLKKDNLDENNLLYSFILSIFYVLSIVKNYRIEMERKKFFLRMGDKKRDSMPDIYKESKIVGYDRWRIIFARDNFYYVASFSKKPFRGVFYVYDEREIRYVEKSINNELFLFEDLWKGKREIKCLILLDHINKEQNNVCLVCFREMMARNVRNKREEMQYTESRLKLALRIISLIKGTIIIEKDGRRNKYFKRKIP